MKPRAFLLCIVAAAVAACATTPYFKEPVIADLEDDKVIVQREHSDLPGNIFGRANTATVEHVKQVASRGCGIHDKTAIPISNSCGRTVFVRNRGNICAATNYLFACK